MPANSRGALLLLVQAWVAIAAHAGQADAQPFEPPPLEITVSPGLERLAARLRAHDAARLLGVMRVVGLREGGGPIHVRLAAEFEPVARSTPGWIVGVARPALDTVILLPERTLAYPDDSLEDVLDHEVAHVLIHRASGGRRVPRWFDEGLAMTAERVWGIEDRARMALELIRGSRVTLGDLDPLFHSTRGDATRAYALSGAFVRYLFDRHGPTVGARILGEMSRGTSFGRAFLLVTGHALVSAEADFRGRRVLWSRWVPFLTSSVALWIGITLLALLAILLRRARSAAMRRRWDALDADPDRLENDPPRWVH
jgi:hypothetical protein